jgi:hypothetical protein
MWLQTLLIGNKHEMIQDQRNFTWHRFSHLRTRAYTPSAIGTKVRERHLVNIVRYIIIRKLLDSIF